MSFADAPRSVVIIVNAIPRLPFRSCNARASTSRSCNCSLHPAIQVTPSQSRSRNFSLIVPLSQLAMATGPSLSLSTGYASSVFLGGSLIKKTYTLFLSLSFPVRNPIAIRSASLLLYLILPSLHLFNSILWHTRLCSTCRYL